eukprot:gnl/TRDRNA2_/TRDRNA2_167273_c0_seq1.p1 gnl/TRDRNA2_/TRDRNA2_167273_c0~~gnl/TRDRNA2_/TRDRNA2_167273_c0_seq1.p1  ORF type:complete len:408 (-),score=49.92 gnl/TRDRNA2_/TRDRNA2_167273_c0_seq1:379-1602(-)
MDDSNRSASSSPSCAPSSSEKVMAVQDVGASTKSASTQSETEEEQQVLSSESLSSEEPVLSAVDSASKRKRREGSQEKSPRKLAKRDTLPHRRMEPTSSCLRRAISSRSGMHIKYADQDGYGDLKTEIGIRSLRNLGGMLWIRNPGASVWCDKCERSVLQSMGCLEGDASKSHFTHDTFVCDDCAAQNRSSSPSAEMPSSSPAASNNVASTAWEVIANYPLWVVCRCAQGVYYGNKQTGESTWVMPPELLAAMWGCHLVCQNGMHPQRYPDMYTQAYPDMYGSPGGPRAACGGGPYSGGHGPEDSIQSDDRRDSLRGRIGRLSKFIEDEGFGFIEDDDVTKGDIFMHFSQIKGAQKEDCIAGMTVKYDIELEGNGEMRATNVTMKACRSDLTPSFPLRSFSDRAVVV